MRLQKKLTAGRKRRIMSVRAKLRNNPERPRLSVHRSLKHISAQVIDDVKGHTLASATTTDKAVGRASADGKPLSKTDLSKLIGEMIAKRALEKGVTKVVFDRGSFRYHGRIKALAESARKAGLVF